MFNSERRLVPRHLDGEARIAAIGRLSKPKPTDEETTATIESSLAVVRAHLKSIYDGPMRLSQFAEQESGLIADRATILEVEALIASGELDLVIAEDLSRIYRSPRHQHVFVDECVDAGVRVICVADLLDTADENWETAMSIASLRHSMPIVDTRRRQKRKSHFAFHKGGNVQKVKFGYRKLTREESASGKYGPVGLMIAKESHHTPTIKKMRELIMTPKKEGYGWGRLLRYLNEDQIPVGPYVEGGKWTRQLAKCLLTDPILMGQRRFRTILCTRVRGTGRFRREPNPNGPETEFYPELAHLTKDEFASMQEVINKIADQHQSTAGAGHSLYRRPSRNALFPRQHATCFVCKGIMYAYDKVQIKCENAHKPAADQCWNHVQVHMEQVCQKVIPWLVGQMDQAPGVRELVVNAVVDELSKLRAEVRKGGSGRRATIAQLEREAANIAKAIRTAGKLEALAREAKEIDDQLRKLRGEEALAAASEELLPSCHSHDDVDRQLNDVLLHLAATSFDFADLLREIIPRFEIVPIQAIDCGLVRPRARITLSLNSLSEGISEHVPIPEVQAEIDLFDPPKRFRHIDACREIKRDNPKLSYVKIANVINQRLAEQRNKHDPEASISYMTVKRCFDILRRMDAEGLSEPYRVLTERPLQASRWKPRASNSDDAA